MLRIPSPARLFRASFLLAGLILLGGPRIADAASPCICTPTIEDGVPGLDDGRCMPGYLGHEIHDADSDTTATGGPDLVAGDWVVSAPPGPADTVRFETDEGTWISVDLSPDGGTLVFDVLGDLYRMPFAGGAATRITSGPAYDFQPRFSPDGSEILFTSDRGGTDNIWAMKPDGSDLRPLTSENHIVMNSADWSPDGETIVARKRLTDGSSIGTVELWLYSTLGGSGLQVTKKGEIPDANGPVFSPDGRWIYFAARDGRYRYNRNVYEGIWQIRAFDRETGRLRGITDGFGGSARPRLSPDGKTLSFIRRDRETTCLFLLDLATGREWKLFDGLDPDMQENFAWTGSYPGYDWTPDGGEIVISFGGKIHAVNTTSGAVRTIPFAARVEQQLLAALNFPREIAPARLRVRMLSWPTLSPDGKSLVFSALGRLYRQTLPDGRPEILRTEGARAYAPAFSRDGKRLAYVSWNDTGGGYVWTMPAGGGASRRVTTIPGQYSNPAFSPDGARVAFLKGSGATLRGHSLGSELYLDLLWAPVDGGTPSFVVSTENRGSSRRMPRLSWSADGARILYCEDQGAGPAATTALVSIRPDGTDSRTHLKVKYAEEIVPSPDGKWAAFSRLHEGFIAPLPQLGTEPLELSGESGAMPGHKFSSEGADWLNWTGDGGKVTWGFGPNFYALAMTAVRGEWDHAKAEAAQKAVPKPAAADSAALGDAGEQAAAAVPAAEDDAGAKPKAKEEDFAAHPDTLEVMLTVPRAKPVGSYALTGARIVTMEGAQVIENGTVLVRDDRIAAVGPAASVRIPAGTRTIDCAGKTIIPGLIDVHAHLHYEHLDIIPEAMNTYYTNLAYGVTTTHDPSASTYAVFTQSEMVEAGVTVGPRTFSTGFILYGADIANKAPVNSLEDARHHIRRLRHLGAFSVKSYMQPSRIQRQWIIQAAREESVLVMPEGGGNLEMNLSMVLDGHTGIEHALPVAPLYRDVVQLFANSGVGYTPTLLVAYGGLSGEHWFYQHDEVWQNEKLLRFMPRGAIDARARRRPVMAPDGDWHHMDVAAGCKAIVEAGGRVQLGAHGQLQGLGVHWELWGLTQGGMSNLDALRCATLFGAEYLGIDHLAGSVSEGKLADLVVLDGNPLEDIHNSNTVRYVVKNGEVFEGETMDRVWPAAVPCPRFYWQTEE